jgi:excisionase family DNA binding protein
MSEFRAALPTEARLPGGSLPLGRSDDLLLRVEVAADRIQVSRAQMYRLLAVGEVKSVKIGASRRVPLRALNDFVDRLMAEQG